ncbi:MAG: protein of unknown function (DUF1602) [Halorubrum sp. J07HR59]|nr:MAG: protein of unknown function (DUF1602) [Halorubrum sp. J07HR59]
MGPLFDNPAVVHDDDPVGILDRREPVCDDEGRPVSDQPGETLLDVLFSFGVDVARCLVENDDGRVVRIARAMESRCRCPPDS